MQSINSHARAMSFLKVAEREKHGILRRSGAIAGVGGGFWGENGCGEMA